MNIKRLTQLLELAKTIDPKQFDIESWTSNLVVEDTPVHKCNTVCCIIGYAMQHKPFNDEGFGTDGIRPVFEGMVVPDGGICGPVYDFDAVVMFFDIPKEDAHHLFLSYGYPNGVNTTLEEVINRLDDYIHRPF